MDVGYIGFVKPTYTEVLCKQTVCVTVEQEDAEACTAAPLIGGVVVTAQVFKQCGSAAKAPQWVKVRWKIKKNTIVYFTSEEETFIV